MEYDVLWNETTQEVDDLFYNKVSGMFFGDKERVSLVFRLSSENIYRTSRAQIPQHLDYTVVLHKFCRKAIF
jgi:hypothetical protein